MNWLDHNYINRVSYRLRNFKRKSETVVNASCPLCGDSKTNAKRARGYIYIQSGKYVYHCHKCGAHMLFRYFLKEIDYGLYQEYVKDFLMDTSKKPDPVEDNLDKFKTKPVFRKDLLKDLTKISSLPVGHYAKSYVDGRLIPSEFHYRLYLCDHFKAWTNKLSPGKFESEKMDEARLVIPFLNSNGNLIGFQGRSFDEKAEIRYITIMLDESYPKIFGLDKVDLEADNVYVVEGPIDSFFIPNCLASAGGSITTDLLGLYNDPKKFVVIYDNEPRSKFTVKKVQKAIDAGFRVCIWPDGLKGSDPNAMVKSGTSISKLKQIIEQNTYSGLSATLELGRWKKI